MRFDPATLLTIAFLTLLSFAVVLATVMKRSHDNMSRRWWIACFLLGASGFLLLVLLPAGTGTQLQIAANTLFLSAYGCAHAGARSLSGREPNRWALAIAFAAWPLVTAAINPDFAGRVLISSMLVCAYSAATAMELARGVTREERNRYLAAGLWSAHAAFYLARAIFGPALGLVNASPETVVSNWGAIIALEIVLFAAAAATLVVGITLERARLEERRDANTDFLTGIGNRRAFEAAMRKVVSSVGNRTPAMLLLLDLDEFKQVNDRLGHEAGDNLLKGFVDEVRQQIPEPSLFWRLGGDEFAVLLNECRPDEAELIKERLRCAVGNSDALRRAQGSAAVSVSIGSAALRPGEAMPNLVRRADEALYREKKKRPRLDRALPRLCAV